jgi:predicted ribosomally synthesized peptide with nif11-like leader
VSVENLKKYGQLCAKDIEVREKAKEIGIKNLDGQIAHGKSLGLEFSLEDIEALAKEIGLDGHDELSEEDLKEVAGGAITVTAAAVVVLAFAGMVATADLPGWLPEG